MYESLIENIERNIEKEHELMTLIRALPELEGIERTQTYDERMFILVMPYDYEMFKRNRAALLAAGWKQAGDIDTTQGGNGIVTFYQGANRWVGFAISIHLEVDLPGATCKRNLLGYEQKPVYEIVCLNA